jgi:16S rRNA (cytosine1402-N4)-methyltransferase
MTLSVEGLRMTQEFNHQPVLVDEVTEMFQPVPAGVVVDATLGGAGHAIAILDAREDLGIFGIDRDRLALAAASQQLSRFGDRSTVIRGEFSSAAELLAQAQGDTGTWPSVGQGLSSTNVVGILADLGVSSPQLDVAGRGFSFSHDGPLDMRMNQDQTLTASLYLQEVSLNELTTVLRHNGEGRFSRRIAVALKDAGLIETTQELVAVVDRAVPKAGRRRGHVAARVFQALRIAVNGEDAELKSLLDAAISIVVPAGRIVVISYHSGEDAVVKHLFRDWASGGCTCPEHLPCVCGAVSRGSVVTKRAVVATDQEIARNPRARSARLRVFEVAS